MNFHIANFQLSRDLITVTLSSLLAYYVIQLEKGSCTCSQDWRRDYIKYYSISMIVYFLLSLALPFIRNNAIMYVIAIFAGINIYAVYTYVRDLEHSGCTCAVKDYANIHEFFKFQSLIVIIIIGLALVVLVSLIITTVFGKLLDSSGYTAFASKMPLIAGPSKSKS
jgi:hypothetical protein